MSATPFDWTPWIGLPHVLWARGPEAYDCWGLVLAVLRAAKGITQLPSSLDGIDRAESRAVKQYLEGWKLVRDSRPQPFDILMTHLRKNAHPGVVCTPPRFLHTDLSLGSRIERYTEFTWCNRIEGFYRYQP